MQETEKNYHPNQNMNMNVNKENYFSARLVVYFPIYG